MKKHSKILIISGIIGFAAAGIILAFLFIFSSNSKTTDEVIDVNKNISSVQIQEQVHEVTEEKTVFAFNPPVAYTVIPENPRRGEMVIIGVNTNEIEALLIVNERQIGKSKFFTIPAEGGNPEFRAAFLAIPATARAGSASIHMINEWGAFYEIPITIAPREFRSETLHLNPTVTTLVTEPNPQRVREAEILWGIWSTTGNTIYHSGRHLLPVTTTRITSPFGFRRTNIFSNGTSSSSIHAGIDYGLPTGTEVRSSGRGMVRLSRMRILTGYSVVIEHAPGIYSMYYHLDSVSAVENTIVEAGALIGRVGSTGFSTGPHLHWEFRVSGEYVDPDIFVNRALIDKNLIISRIFSNED